MILPPGGPRVGSSESCPTLGVGVGAGVAVGVALGLGGALVGLGEDDVAATVSSHAAGRRKRSRGFKVAGILPT